MTVHQPVRGDVAVLVPAAGAGVRFGAGEPKALRELAGVPLLVHAVRRVVMAPSVGVVVVAAPVDRTDDVAAMVRAEMVRTQIGAGVELRVVPGGATRQASVRAALGATPADYQIVLVHDAARALAPPALVERVAAAVRAGHQAVIPVLAAVDTVKRVDAAGFVVATVDRSALRLAQTPQGFARATLVEAHRAAVDDLTDDAGLAERIGSTVFCVPGEPAAMKITQPADLGVARALLALDGAGRNLSS